MKGNRKRMEKLTLDGDIEAFIARLELYKGRWALEIKGQLYVFPEETTRQEAEEVIRRACELRKMGPN